MNSGLGTVLLMHACMVVLIDCDVGFKQVLRSNTAQPQCGHSGLRQAHWGNGASGLARSGYNRTPKPIIYIEDRMVLLKGL